MTRPEDIEQLDEDLATGWLCAKDHRHRRDEWVQNQGSLGEENQATCQPIQGLSADAPVQRAQRPAPPALRYGPNQVRDCFEPIGGLPVRGHPVDHWAPPSDQPPITAPPTPRETAGRTGIGSPGPPPLSALFDRERRRRPVIYPGALLGLAVLVVVIVAVNAIGHVRVASPSAPAEAPTPAGPEVAIPALGATIAVGKDPGFAAVSPNGRHVYVIHADAHIVTVLDTMINQVTATIPIDAGPPQFLAFAPDGRMLYVSIFNDQKTLHSIDVIDTASDTVVATIPQQARPFLPAVSPDGTRLYVPNHDIAAVSVIDTATNRVIDHIKTAPNPHWVAFSPDGRRAYTANHMSNMVSVIDTTALTMIATIPVGTSPHSIAVNPHRPLVANVNFDGDSVSLIDTDSLKVVATIPVGHTPQDIAWAPDGRFAYVVNNASNTVSVIDARTDQVTATIPVGAAPNSIAVLPNGREAYVSNTTSGTVTILELTG
ncbi:MAG: beta-propeller fold lactonase family protein [Pseudonocardiaceae bacterium]